MNGASAQRATPAAVGSPSSPVVAGLVLRAHDMRAGRERLASIARAAADAGIDHLTVGDHVSFADGDGADGLIQATALLASHPTLPVQTGVYLLPLRHPAVVARQLATISDIAPGRLTFGVGLGGDDPRELELCGVDPRTRGARMTEGLELLRAFLTGDPVTFAGQFFSADAGAIRPAPNPPIPILVGGRSQAAVVRTGRLGDGWLALWVSPRRLTEAVQTIEETAAAAGRSGTGWRHTLQLWAGLDTSHERAAARLRPVMERAYNLPFERFARYCPCGRPDDVAAALDPYLDAGCRRFNFVCEADSVEAAIEGVAAVKSLLSRAAGSSPPRQPANRDGRQIT